MKLKTSSLLIAGALFSAAVMPAHANNEAMMDLLKVLRDQGTITAANYDLLSNAAKADKEASEAVKMSAEKADKNTSTLKKLSWAEKIKIKGDTRFRYENRVTEDQQDTDRLRIRARVGVYAQVNDDVKAGMRFVSTSNDATSTNETLDDNFESSNLGWDLAYIDWAPSALGGDSRFIFGKMKKPWQKVNDLIWDGDTNPEGVAYAGKFKMSGFTLLPSVGYYALGDDTNGGSSIFEDSHLVHAQLAAKIGKIAKVGISYYGFESQEGEEPGGSDVQNEEQLTEIFGESKIPGTPFKVYGSFVTNSNNNATGDDNAFSLGTSAKFGNLKAGYEYRDTGEDAINYNFDNSDFQDGSKGHILKAGYKIDKNFSLGSTYFITERNSDGRDRERFQLDLKANF
ncbi:putative porin [Pseudomonadota bacterium]|nr:putative porin [Pseudomonadota bacterium]